MLSLFSVIFLLTALLSVFIFAFLRASKQQNRRHRTWSAAAMLSTGMVLATILINPPVASAVDNQSTTSSARTLHGYLITAGILNSGSTSTALACLLRGGAACIFKGDIQFAPRISGGADITVAPGDAGTPGGTLDLVAGAGGSALIVLDGGIGQNGANLTLTAGAGTDRTGGGDPAGAGGNVILTGGARGGSTGSPLVGMVKVGNPTMGLTPAVDVLGVAGGIESDGPVLFAAAAPNGDTVLAVTACGVDQFIGAAGDDFTLPAPTAGCRIRFIVDANFATTSMTIVTASSANVIFGSIDVNSTLVPCDAEDTITVVNTAELKGDFVELRSDGTSWFLSGMGVTTGSFTCTQAS